MSRARFWLLLGPLGCLAPGWPGSSGAGAAGQPHPKASLVAMNKLTGLSQAGNFLAHLPPGFAAPADAVGQRILREYGALFLARGGAVPPPVVRFHSEAEVAAFQQRLRPAKARLGRFEVELQAAALAALQAACAEAARRHLRITPRGVDAARRDYATTAVLWASRVNPGLAHYVAQGKIAPAEAARIKALAPSQQVPEIFRLEARGLFFSKDLSKSIMYSVAPPGASQHLSLLALDVSEFGNPAVREILARHGWFQTVLSDEPHFTFLGVAEKELSGLGLKKVVDSGQGFYVPDL